MSFFKEIWMGFRPYLIKMVQDLLISCTLWFFLYLFKLLTKQLEIAGWAADFIVNIHAAGATIAFGVFVVLFILDIVGIRRGGEQ